MIHESEGKVSVGEAYEPDWDELELRENMPIWVISRNFFSSFVCGKHLKMIKNRNNLNQ